MMLMVKFIVRISLFVFIGLIVGVIVLFVIPAPNTFMKSVCLIGGPIGGIIISLFTLDSLVEKYYADNAKKEAEQY